MARLSHVLILDSNAKGRETLGYGFAGDAVGSTLAADQASARAGLEAQRPDVLIVVAREGDDEVARFLRALGDADAPRTIPRLLLIEGETLPTELRTSGPQSAVIPLPAFVRDVITAAKLLAGSAAHAADKPRANGKDPAKDGGDPAEELVPAISGALSDYGLYFIVRTMVGLRRSGIINVARANRTGELRFSEGDAVSAQVGTLQGPAALHQLLLWEEAALDVKLGPVARLGQPFPKGDELLEDTERFLRDFESATKSIGQAQSLFVQDAEKAASMLDVIPVEVVPVMRLFDGQRSLGDVLEDSPFRVFDTLRIITRLLEMAVIRRKAIEKPSVGLSGQLNRPRLEDWLSRGAEAPPVVRAAAPHPRAPLTTPSSGVPVPIPAPGGAVAAAVNGGAPSDQRNGPSSRRRNPRRRTGEVPLSGAAMGSAPASDKSGELHVRGELRSPDRPFTPPPSNVPSVMVDLGSDTANTEPPPPVTSAPEAPAAGEPEAVPSPASLAVNAPSNKPMTTPPPISEPAPAIPAFEAAPLEAAAAPRDSGVKVAEFDTGMRPQPPPELLEAPGSGPSIMLDPNLMAEMDAFELANTAPTPPPVVLAPAPSPAAPVTPPAATPAVPAAVVSFVHHGTPAHPSGLPLNAAPTVPVVPVKVTPPAAPANLPPALTSAETPPPRRASSEFDAVESDFFARESDLYATDAPESFDDLDPSGRRRQR